MTNNIMSVEDRLTKARINLLIHYPFFGILSLKLQIKEDVSCPTAGTDGNYLYYNTDFINGLNDRQIAFVIIHETMHCALRHIWRLGNKQKTLWNMACDYAIHSILKSQSNYIEMLKDILYDSRFNDMSAEQIYEILLNEAASNNGNNGDGNGNNGTKVIDDHSKWGQHNNTKNESNFNNEQDWEAAIVNAAKQVANTDKAGSIPGYFKRLIKEITEPTKDWRIVLREFIEPEPNDYTFIIPDYRLDYDVFGCFLPSFNEEMQKVNDIYFWVDTSGSISDYDLDKIYSEVAGAVQQFDKFTGYLGFFDSVAYEPKCFNDINELKQIKPEGGGGTSFHAPFEYMEKHDISPKAVIMLTDGYCTFPNEGISNCPVIWLITTRGIEAPWGKNIFLDIS